MMVWERGSYHSRRSPLPAPCARSSHARTPHPLLVRSGASRHARRRLRHARGHGERRRLARARSPRWGWAWNTHSLLLCFRPSLSLNFLSGRLLRALRGLLLFFRPRLSRSLLLGALLLLRALLGLVFG